MLGVEKLREPRGVDIDVFTPEKVMALVRAAASEQDAAIFLTAAFMGLRRGELVALRWRDVYVPGSLIRVRATYTHEVLTTPKSGRVRSVPMVPEVATALARLGQRGVATGDQDQVFLGPAHSGPPSAHADERNRVAVPEPPVPTAPLPRSTLRTRTTT